MQTLELRNLDAALRDAILAAHDEPIVLTEGGRPAYVIRSLTDDDLADELLTSNPDFLASIQIARQQKAQGRVKTLAELREQYNSSDE